MPSTFSTNYSIELITTGEQAGQWGDTTNRNYLRFEQMAGGVATITVDDYPVEAQSSWNSDDKIFDWFTSDTAEAGDVDSEGRCKYVSFTSVGFVGGDSTVKIFGDNSTDSPTRVFIVKNDLVVSGDDRPSLTLRSGPSLSSTVTVPNGKSALVYSYGADIKNTLDSLQFSSVSVGTLETDFLDVSGAASGDAQIKIPDGVAEALKFVVGSSSVMGFNTSGSSNAIDMSSAFSTTSSVSVGDGLTVSSGDTTTQDLDVNGDLSVTGKLDGFLLIRDIKIVTTGSTTGGSPTPPSLSEDICSHEFDFTGRSSNSRVLIIGSVDLLGDPDGDNDTDDGITVSVCNVNLYRNYGSGGDVVLSNSEQTPAAALALLENHTHIRCSYPLMGYVNDVPPGTAKFIMRYEIIDLGRKYEWSNGGMILIDLGNP